MPTITVYAQVSDFTAALPATAWGARTIVDVNQALADASSEMDDFFRGRYPLPLIAVPQTVARRCALLARYLFLGGRGFSPATESDKDITKAATDVYAWLDEVQRRVRHPLTPGVHFDANASVVQPLDSVAAAQPLVVASSVVDDRGRVCATRGW
jgi:hypothetical protein